MQKSPWLLRSKDFIQYIAEVLFQTMIDRAAMILPVATEDPHNMGNILAMYFTVLVQNT